MVRRRVTPSDSNSLLRRIAAAWFVRNLTRDDDSGSFRDWVEADPQREREYARIEATWNALAILKEDAKSEVAASVPTQSRVRRWRTPVAVASVAALLLAIGASMWLAAADNRYQTGVGDQRVVSLADGSLITLNTDSRVEVEINDHVRRVTLDRGEAFFDIAHLPHGPPFEVIGGGVDIHVVGTRFNVRLMDQGVGLDVIEGRVETRRTTAAAATVSPVVLTAGQRADFDSRGIVRARGATDQERVTSWRLGRVRLNDTSLSEAVREMNRYSDRKLVIGSPQLNELRVSGVFRMGNVESFADALKLSNGLQVTSQGDNLVVTDPRAP
ncbi:MAG TPA: FecR domain-containing protein [Steroidobacteraceae bacterium]|jgi:transmembrane sensor